MTPTSLSIVMPARNAEATIGMAIQSCLAQTLPDFELVLVDHHSSDGTYSVMKKFARQDSRIHVLRARTGSNFIAAANFAWHEARGKLIARMDADDFAYSARLQHQVRFLAEHPEVQVCAAQVRIRKRNGQPPDEGYAEYERWINGVVKPKAIAAERFVDSPVPNPTAVMRREILEQFGGYADEIWAEDYDLWLRFLEKGHKIGKVDQVLLDWYDGENRATRTQTRYSMENFQRAKAHYLARLDPVVEQGVTIAGAGPIGKKMARFLKGEGIRVRAFFDVSEKKIGNAVDRVPVFSREAIGDWLGKSVLLGAVGIRGSREDVRAVAVKNGFTEGDDFFCVA